MDQKFDQRFTNIDQTVDALTGRVNGFDNCMDGFATQLNTMDFDIEQKVDKATESKLGDITSDVATLSNRLNNHTNKAAKLVPADIAFQKVKENLTSSVIRKAEDLCKEQLRSFQVDLTASIRGQYKADIEQACKELANKITKLQDSVTSIEQRLNAGNLQTPP